MTSEDAVAIAERYLSTKGVAHGPLRTTHYFPVAQDETLTVPACWAVYFWDDQPVETPPDDMAATCLCVNVDPASGAAQLVCWL
jgi:hypothetical protein